MVWEYKRVTVQGTNEEIETQLNLLGADGWELAAAFHEHLSVLTCRHELILKRQAA